MMGRRVNQPRRPPEGHASVNNIGDGYAEVDLVDGPLFRRAVDALGQ